MCVACERKSKRLGLPRHTWGKVKFWAHRAVRGFPWPIFRDRRINVAIEAHISRIQRARTFRSE
jgi:hypothetical protein